MVTQTLGAVALALVASALTSCCRRACEPPAAAPVPVADVESPDTPFIGIRPGGERVQPELVTTATITVLDADGSPVRAAQVRVWREDDVARRSHHFGGASAAGLPWHESDKDGVVVLDRLASGGTYHLFVGAPRDRPELRDAAAVAAWRPRDETVRLRRWRVIRGIVRDADGTPVVGAAVSTRDRVDDGWRGASTDEAGRFTIQRIPDGTIALEVNLGDGLMTRGAEHPQRPITTATVTAGDEQVVLVADVGQELVVRLEEPDGRPPSEHARGREFDALAYLWLSAPGSDGALAAAQAYVRQGVARFRGLRADEAYTLWVTPSKEGNIVYETGVRAGDRRFLRRPGKPITVNVLAPAGATAIRASIGDAGPFGAFDGGGRSSPGPIEVGGVPDGTWRVSAWAKVGEEFWHGSGTAAAGSSVDVEVRPSRPSR